MARLRRLVVFAVLCSVWAAPLPAQQMPDPSQIHGRALPGPELPTGTVTVRVVRESIGNDAQGERVSLTVGGKTTTASTDAMGRAVFDDLPVGQEARATATVDGEALESQPFEVPASGGLRVILVAGIARAAERRAKEAEAAAAAPAVNGAVVFGGNSRVLMQFTDDTLQVYYVLDVVNNARARVDVGAPLIVELPRAAQGATVLEGSSPAGVVDGTRLTITGPFASGTTPVQVAYRLPYASSTLTLTQAFPVPFEQLNVGVEKVGALTLTSSQLPTVTDVAAEAGTVFVLGRGPALAAGTPLVVTLNGLQYHSATPRYVALGLAVAFLGLGAWLAFSTRGRASSKQALANRRESLLQELAQLETKRQAGTVSGDRYAIRRQRAVQELEHVMGQLDEASAPLSPQGGGEGAVV